MIRKSLFVLVLLLTTVSLCLFGVGEKEEWPTRKIQWVFPWKAGIPVYIHAQLTAQYLSEELGVEVNVVAQPGGGGTKAANYVLNQPADGYTLFDAWVAPLVFAGLVRDNIGYTWKDFKPVGGLNLNPWTLVVRKNQPINTLEEFIEYARKNPGMKYNAGGENVVPHAATAWFLKEYGIKARNVPYPGLAAGFPDFLSGTLDFTIAPPIAYMKTYADRMRPLAVFLEERHRFAPDVPTAAELGYKPPFTNSSAAGWNFLVARAETPDHIVTILQNALKKVVQNEEYRKKCDERMLTLYYIPPQDYEKTCTNGVDEFKKGIEAIKWEKEQF